MEATYEDFEPFSSWRREQGCDTLEIHLPGFKKQQLRVQINSVGVLKVSGERQVDEKIQRRFYKEYKVPKDCNTDAIQAKFSSGILHVIMPKKTVVESKRTLSQQFEDDKNQNSTTSTQKDSSSKKPTNEEKHSDNKQVQTQITNNVESSTANSTSGVRRFVKAGMSVAVVVALVSVLGFYVFSKYKSTLLAEV